MSEYRDILGKSCINRKIVDQVVLRVQADESDFTEHLYPLLFDTDSKVSWHAAWVCTHLCKVHPEWFLPYRDDFMKLIQQEGGNEGVKRQILHILEQIPIIEPLNVGFFDFCLEHMFDMKSPFAVQVICLKLAYKMCLLETELLPEYKCILINTELDYFSSAIKSSVRNILKKINKNV